MKYSNLNFDPDTILSAGAVLVDYPTVEERVAFIKRAEAALNEHPEIEAAALLQRYHSTVRLVEALGSYVLIDGESYAREEDYPYVHYNRITPGFFRAMGVDLLEGRDFNLSDTPDSLPVLVVNRSFASRHWPGESALGKRVKFRSRNERPWLTVIGVVPDLLLQGIENRRAPEDGLYLPYYQQPRYLSIGMVLRGKTDNMSRLATVLRTEMRKLDPNLGLMEVETLREGMDQVLITRNILTNVLLLFGALSLLLASLGLFGVMNFSVGQKGVEIAIRMALGAPGGRLLLSVMKAGMRQLGYGLALGWLISIGLAGILEAFLYDVDSIDLQVCLVVIFVLSFVCMVSCYLPARRAVLTQPMELLRYQ